MVRIRRKLKQFVRKRKGIREKRDTIGGGGEQEILASFASPVIHPAGNIYIHIYQELLRDELHDQLLWPLVCISETKDGRKTSSSLCISTIYSTLCKYGPNAVTHRFSPWLTWTWQGRERVSFVLESMEEALGFCGD